MKKILILIQFLFIYNCYSQNDSISKNTLIRDDFGSSNMFFFDKDSDKLKEKQKLELKRFILDVESKKASIKKITIYPKFYGKENENLDKVFKVYKDIILFLKNNKFNKIDFELIFLDRYKYENGENFWGFTIVPHIKLSNDKEIQYLFNN